MAFNGSGTYSLPAGNPVVTGTTISSSTTNTTNSDIATALTNCITRDGQSTPSANLPMNAKKLTGLAAGTSAGDSVRYEQIQYINSVASAGTLGQVLTSAGTGAPTWQTSTDLPLSGGVMTGAITFNAGQTISGYLPLSGGVMTGGIAFNAGQTVDGTNKIGYLNIPLSGIKTASYTLVAGDVGKFIELGTSGSVVVPASVFAAGDAISIFNNTAASISCTCSDVTTVYKGGTDADISSFSVTTRGVATILFITATVAVVTGNLA